MVELVLNDHLGSMEGSVYYPQPCCNSPVESEVDLDLEYIENVLTDYDSQHLQKQEST